MHLVRLEMKDKVGLTLEVLAADFALKWRLEVAGEVVLQVPAGAEHFVALAAFVHTHRAIGVVLQVLTQRLQVLEALFALAAFERPLHRVAENMIF